MLPGSFCQALCLPRPTPRPNYSQLPAVARVFPYPLRRPLGQAGGEYFITAD